MCAPYCARGGGYTTGDGAGQIKSTRRRGSAGNLPGDAADGAWDAVRLIARVQLLRVSTACCYTGYYEPAGISR
jgi:hypothetical protein